MYLILKAFARVLVTSGRWSFYLGHIAKDEVEYQLFHNYEVFQDEDLKKFHQSRNPDKQKVFLLSNAITDE